MKKIVILGSTTFRNEKVKIKEQLESFGYQVLLDNDTEDLAMGKNDTLLARINQEHSQIKKERDYIRVYAGLIGKSDAVLVLNYKKKEIKGYIGSNTFFEILDAHCKKKIIFLMFPKPDIAYIKDEIDAVETICLEGNIETIKKYL